LSKHEILEVYVNSIYLGRGAWGVDMAAHSYFKKPAAELNVAEAAFLAGLAKGPASFNPDRFPARARGRLAYVLKRMQEDKLITEEQFTRAMAAPPRVAVYERPRRTAGFHFVDHVGHEARTLVGMQSLTVDSYTVRSTINPKLQRATEAALQEGLAQYEISTNRARFSGPELNLTESVQRIDAEQKTRALRRDRVHRPVWQMALQQARMPLYDVHWTPAVVLEISKGGGVRVGLPDGSVLPLAAKDSERRQLKQYDVVYVKSEAGRRKNEGRAELRSRPKVQGAAVVLENGTGRILAMVGGFSYPLSQLNRVTQAKRQPGSSIKPLTYLAALHQGLQPDTLVMDAPVTLPPISGGGVRSGKYWSPKNYEGGARGVMTLRRALENSRNMVTARLLKGGIADSPKESLYQICDLAEEAALYPECLRLYPFILGAQAIRAIDLAGFYSAVAREGAYYKPYAIESIEHKDGTSVYRVPPAAPKWLADGDQVAFYQLRTILEGVLTRGTARSLSHLATYAGGKTGTTDDENDAWFAAFTKDVTVVVWVGYDNLNGRRTLGSGGTGGRVAAPIADQILQASWNHYPKVPLPPPSPTVMAQVKAVSMGRGEDGGYTEYYRLNSSGKVAETKHALVGRQHAPDYDDEPSGSVTYQQRRSVEPLPPYQYRSWGWGSSGSPYHNPNSVLRRQEDRY
jgi:membrane carboxypeptidase/penicillin-binding protein